MMTMRRSPESVAKTLVFAFEQAEQDVSFHYMHCLDQREEFDCRECARVNEARYRARKAMEANPDAARYYQATDSRDRRRDASRFFLQVYRDSGYENADD